MARDVDPSAYNYGNDPNKAAQDAAKYQQAADAAQNRQGEQIHNEFGNQDRDQALGARGSALSMADMMRDRASGKTPSIAGMRANNDIGRAVADQSSIAASARGPAALALASQQAAAGSSNAISNISNQAQVNSAQERSDAEKNAFGAYSGLRQGDQAQQGQDFSQGLAQAQLNQQQRGQNDAFTLGEQGQGIGVQSTQMAGQMNKDAAQQSHDFNTEQLAQQKREHDDDMVLGAVGSGLQAGSSIATLSDERAKVPVRWGSGGAAPIDTGYGSNSEETGSGYDTNSVNMARMVAHHALNQKAAGDTAASAQDAQAGGGGGPMMAMSNAGMGALKDRDHEDLGLIQAKERNGVNLTSKEEAGKASLQHRVGQDSKKPSPPAGPPAGAGDKGPSAVGALGGAAGGIGKALSGMGASGGHSTYHYTPAAQHALPTPPPGVPMQMYSDERTKSKASGYEDAKFRGLGAVGATSDDATVQWDQDAGGKLGRSAVVKLSDDAASGGEGSSGGRARLGGKAGDTVNMADAERARGEAIAARKKAEAPRPAERKMTMAELTKYGRDLQGSVHAQKDAQLAAGPSARDPHDAPKWLDDYMTSDERAKTPAKLTAAEEAKDAEETRKFMGDSKPMAPDPQEDKELRDRAAYDAKEAAHAQKEEAARAETHAAAQWADKNDAESARRIRGSALTPGFIKDWAAGRVENRRFAPESERADRARKYADHDAKLSELQHAHDSDVPASIKGAVDATKRPRQPTSFVRGDADSISDERAKNVGNLGKEVPRDEMADAARSMRAVPYAYKPQYAGHEGQHPGEVNVGPVAQEMEHSPVAATAVKQDSPNGLRAIDLGKFTKVLGGVAAAQQEQLDDQQRQIKSLMARRIGGKR